MCEGPMKLAVNFGHYATVRLTQTSSDGTNQGWAFGPPGPARCFSSPIGMKKLSPIPARSGFGLRKSSPSPIRAELVRAIPVEPDFFKFLL